MAFRARHGAGCELLVNLQMMTLCEARIEVIDRAGPAWDRIVSILAESPAIPASSQFTVCTIEAKLPLKLAFPAYVAVTVFDPVGKLETASLAVPPDRVAVPSVVGPEVKVTVPVGVA
jgi:hypothetical protein